MGNFASILAITRKREQTSLVLGKIVRLSSSVHRLSIRGKYILLLDERDLYGS